MILSPRLDARTARGALAALVCVASMAACGDAPGSAASGSSAPTVGSAPPTTSVTPPSPGDAARLRATNALGPFKKSLREALLAGLASSPVEAIDVCSKQAPALAAAASRDGVRVGRASERLRNPKNAAPPWLAPVIAELSGAPAGTPASRLVTLPGGGHGYAEAIWIDGPCLLCHGSSVAPDVEAKLREQYPEDAAKGYAPGAFRGVFWAEVAQATEP